jgi:hypothetical protein
MLWSRTRAISHPRDDHIKKGRPVREASKAVATPPQRIAEMEISEIDGEDEDPVATLASEFEEQRRSG